MTQSLLLTACMASALCLSAAEPLVCIVVPFRDGCGWNSMGRSAQLDTFIQDMSSWLSARGHKASRIHFIVSEQSQSGIFNKGLLSNLGALLAFSIGCEHVVFGVDQLPADPKNHHFYKGVPLHTCTRPGESDNCSIENQGLQPSAGSVLMLSQKEYIAVNGYSNNFWPGSGLEDQDMSHRISTVFETLTQQQQDVGLHIEQHSPRAPSPLDSPTQPGRESPALDEETSARLAISRLEDDRALEQLASDGLRQTCHYAEIIHTRHESSKSRLLSVITSDLLPPHAAPCLEYATANEAKLELELEYRRDLRSKGTCVMLLSDPKLAVSLAEIPSLERELCTDQRDFCVTAYTTAAIRASTTAFNAEPTREGGKEEEEGMTNGRMEGRRREAGGKAEEGGKERASERALTEESERGRKRGVAVRQPLREWKHVLTPRMAQPFEPGPIPAIGHPFVMGWNESMAYVRLLVRQRVPFALTRYGDGELRILNRTAEANKEWSWDPDAPGAEKFRELLIQPFFQAQNPEHLMLVGVPMVFCLEGLYGDPAVCDTSNQWHERLAANCSEYKSGGGRQDLLTEYLTWSETAEIGLQMIPAGRYVYSWLFGNLNYNATVGLIATLQDANWPILVVCNQERVANRMAPTWADGVLTVTHHDLEWVREHVEEAKESFQRLARRSNGTAVLLAAGPIANVMVSVMHAANPNNIYLDVGGALDFLINRKATREFHPRKEDASNFVRAGGALVHGQTCTEARWVVGRWDFIPTHHHRDRGRA